MRILEDWLTQGSTVKVNGKEGVIVHLDCWSSNKITWVYSITVKIGMKNIKVEPYKVSR